MDQQNRAGVLSYKEVHLQQLRALVEVALAGSQAGAARVLGVSQPTVWEQVHALERHMGLPLLKIQGRVCLLTDHGEQLVQMALPLLEDFESLKRRLQEAGERKRRALTVVSSPRVLLEDLGPLLPAFEEDHPATVVSLLEFDDDLVIREVLEKRADVGWTPSVPTVEQARYVDIVASYDVDNYLITPLDHPLSKQRRIRPEDILKYRVLNGHGTFYGPRMQGIELQVEHSSANQHRVAAYYVFSIRELVKQGLGIAIVPRLEGRGADPKLYERNVSAFLGRSSINAYQRRGVKHSLIEEYNRFVCQKIHARHPPPTKNRARARRPRR